MRVVILGGGYAGVTVTRRLERQLPEDVEIVLIDETGTHLVQHEVHRVVRRPELADVLTLPLSNLVSRATVRTARVTDLDTNEGTVTIEPTAAENGDNEEDSEPLDGETLTYDYAAVCLGSETEFYGMESVEEHAVGLKSVEEAAAIRERALESPDGNVVIGGAGFSGIQLAGELAALSVEENLTLDITLVEQADQIAPGFEEAFADALDAELSARDVTVVTGVGIESADDATVTLENEQTLPADLFVWTGGIRGPDATAGDRLAVGADLRVDESTFVVGDGGRVTDQDGVEAPASAQTAVRQARVAAKNIRRLVEREDSTEPVDFETYTTETAGWVVSVGDGAIAQVGPAIVSGEPARATKAVIGASHLGSVGAICQASALVAEELGWPGPDCSETAAEGTVFSLPTDPGSAGDLQSLFAELPLSALEAYSGEESIDLTAFTRAADRSYPDGPLFEFQSQVGSLMKAGLDMWAATAPDDDESEPVTIQVEDESDDVDGDSDEDSDDGDEQDDKGT